MKQNHAIRHGFAAALMHNKVFLSKYMIPWIKNVNEIRVTPKASLKTK